jgi:hypothetical protein
MKKAGATGLHQIAKRAVATDLHQIAKRAVVSAGVAAPEDVGGAGAAVVRDPGTKSPRGDSSLKVAKADSSLKVVRAENERPDPRTAVAPRGTGRDAGVPDPGRAPRDAVVRDREKIATRGTPAETRPTTVLTLEPVSPVVEDQTTGDRGIVTVPDRARGPGGPGPAKDRISDDPAIAGRAGADAIRKRRGAGATSTMVGAVTNASRGRSKRRRNPGSPSRRFP